MKENELKACPFCGGRADMATDYNDPFESGAIYCVDCGAKIEFGCGGELRIKGIKKWNNRAKTDLRGYSLPGKGLFGKRVLIPTGIKGEKFVYRVLNDGVRSNSWYDVPLIVCAGSSPTNHGTKTEDVLFVVLDTLISESSRIVRVAKKDVEFFD